MTGFDLAAFAAGALVGGWTMLVWITWMGELPPALDPESEGSDDAPASE
jgi:hypothetical protein